MVVLGAGFDPRSVVVPRLLSPSMGDRLYALVVREERGIGAELLRTIADENEAEIIRLIPQATTMTADIFAADGAVIAGQRIVWALQSNVLPAGLTDIVLDTSALSSGVAFPAAAYLLALCEAAGSALNFHLMIALSPELDARIVGERAEKTSIAKGYDGNYGKTGDDQVASMWLPQLGQRSNSALSMLNMDQDYYKICPILPFPARNPRRSDDLIREYVWNFFRHGTSDQESLFRLRAESRGHVPDPFDPEEALRKDCPRILHTTDRGISSREQSHGGRRDDGGAGARLDGEIRRGAALRNRARSRRCAFERHAGSLVHVWLHGYVYDPLNVSRVVRH